MGFNENIWNKFLNEQKEICHKYGSEFIPADPFHLIGLADDLTKVPVHGMRHPLENSSGWYLWSGGYREDEDFFKPHHIWHLTDSKPEVLKFLGLPPRYRFLIEGSSYEDVWFDELLLIKGG